MTDYLPLYREMAEGGEQFFGLSILQHADAIGKLIRQYKVKSILDYGCGRGDAYKQPHRVHREWGIRWWDIRLFDPSFPEHDEKPGAHERFGAVLCSDVVEHVLPEDIDVFVKTLFSHAKSFVWASFCSRPARKSFPGTEINLHCTQRPPEWWQAKFAEHADGKPFHLVQSP